MLFPVGSRFGPLANDFLVLLHRRFDLGSLFLILRLASSIHLPDLACKIRRCRFFRHEGQVPDLEPVDAIPNSPLQGFQETN